MSMSPQIIIAAGALLALAACATSEDQGHSQAPAAAQAGGSDTVYVRQVMVTRINPPMLAIWDVGNNAMNEEGGIDPALMGDAKWSALATAAGRLEEAAHIMANAQVLRAAQPNNMATAEGEVTMETVQRLLDADPAGFRQLAAEQADHAARLATAAKARDVAAAGELVSGMDGVCESCHARYWYAE